MSKYKSFIFKDYEFDPANKALSLHYSFDDELEFSETYRFPFEFVDYDSRQLDRACQTLFFMAGVSYFKMFIPSNIEIRKGQLDEASAAFYSDTYQKGLGELFYINKLDPRTEIKFPVNSDQLEPTDNTGGVGMLVGIGGGKDSLLSVELARKQPHIATWNLNNKQQLESTIERIGLSHYWAERTLDPKVRSMNDQGVYNGHVPISAIFAAAGTVTAILAGKRDVVVSNENSANEATLVYEEVEINHQYSKSLEFEQKYQDHLQRLFGSAVRYYSLLRPLSELYIADLFSKGVFNKYKGVFSSCNRAFRFNSDSLFWCGECAKCAFIFMALTPFIDRQDLEQLWGGKNLLLDKSLEPIYRQLLGIEGDKPLDCVGEIKESRAAMRLAQEIYPELQKYEFDLPKDYDHKALAGHSMPEEMYTLLKQHLS